MTSSIVNKINGNLRLGYTATADLTQADANSILSRSENDTRYLLGTTTISTLPAPTTALSMNNQKITNLANATDLADALPFGQAESLFLSNGITLNNIGAPTGPLSMNNEKVTNLAAAIDDGDALSLGQANTLFIPIDARLD
jgi:hypothetical protein